MGIFKKITGPAALVKGEDYIAGVDCDITVAERNGVIGGDGIIIGDGLMKVSQLTGLSLIFENGDKMGVVLSQISLSGQKEQAIVSSNGPIPGM